MNTTIPHARRKIIEVLLTVVGMAGIAGLFLPFTYGTSPVQAASDKELWRLAFPFFLAVLASVASIRWVFSGSFSVPERVIAYVVSAAMAGVTLSLWFPLHDELGSTHDWLAAVSPDAVLALGVYLLIRNWRMGPSREFNPVMAIQVAYLANAVFCLTTFFGDWNLGAYFVLVAALAFVLQIILASAPGLDVATSR